MEALARGHAASKRPGWRGYGPSSPPKATHPESAAFPRSCRPCARRGAACGRSLPGRRAQARQAAGGSLGCRVREAEAGGGRGRRRHTRGDGAEAARRKRRSRQAGLWPCRPHAGCSALTNTLCPGDVAVPGSCWDPSPCAQTQPQGAGPREPRSWPPLRPHSCGGRLTSPPGPSRGCVCARSGHRTDARPCLRNKRVEPSVGLQAAVESHV